MCKIHQFKLHDFDYNVHGLINGIIDNKAILSSCRESDNSIISNLFQILADAPCVEFNSLVLRKQNGNNNRGTFNLDNFLISCQNKYRNLVANRL